MDLEPQKKTSIDRATRRFPFSADAGRRHGHLQVK
jgi:hypothetical protein